MGHIRLGNVPTTRKWKQVVALIAGGAGSDAAADLPRPKALASRHAV